MSGDGRLQDTARAAADTVGAFQDPAAGHGAGWRDSVVVESPLPGGVAEVVRFFFHVPQWIQIGGAVLMVLLAISLAVLLWRRRRRIGIWYGTRSRSLRMGLGTAAVALIAVAAGAGIVGWDYVQHDNAFCTGCHVMGPSFQAFTVSEHAEETCHDCHQQSIFASMRQLAMWVAERPEEIGSHAEIPDAICQQCHATGESETWTHVEATAGHRVHLESADPALDGVGCLTCHSPGVHQFTPVDETCGQSGCHDDVEIRLGRMASQAQLHCATCHEFTAEVAALATGDSAAAVLVPSFDNCTGCHEMRRLLGDFEPEREPHGARCGVCHDAHAQSVAEDAARTCAECHDAWRNEPFHVGEAHGDAGEQCTLCHRPHQARVDASDCAACHRRVAADADAPAAMRRRLERAQPFDTAAALRETHVPLPGAGEARDVQLGSDVPRARDPLGAAQPLEAHEPSRSLGTLASTGTPAADVALLLTAPADSFEHSVHEELTCITCHSTSEGHGGLTFERPRGCQICHHRAPARAVCTNCHDEESTLPTYAADVTVEVAGAEPAHRAGRFDHSTHAQLACVACHQAPVSLEPPAEVETCASCHEAHHAADVTCAGCHTADEGVVEVHAPPAGGHSGCAQCHASETIRELEPNRAFCLTCHQAMQDHEPAGQCTTCHLLASPEEWAPLLVGEGAAAS